MESDERLIDTYILKIGAASTGIIVFLIALVYSGELLLENGYIDIGSTTTNIVLSILVLVGSIGSVTFSQIFFDELKSRDAFTAHQGEIMYRVTQIVVYISAVSLIISIWNVDIGNILFGAGIIGIIAGLAARNTLSSILSGIIIMSTDMFRVGHWLEFNSRFGRVEKITFFNTHIISPQNEKHIIPNEAITNENMTNLSGEGTLYRVDLLASISYEENIDEVIQICDNELKQLEENNATQVIYRHGETTVKEFDDSGITISIKAWIKEPNPYRINKAKTTVIGGIHERFKQENIKIPYPHRTIVSENNPSTTSDESQLS